MDLGKTLTDGLTGILGGIGGGPIGMIAGLLSGIAPDLIGPFATHIAGPQGQAVADAVVSAVATATGMQSPTPAAVAGLTPEAREDLQAKLATIVMQAEKNRLDDLASARAEELAQLQASLIDTQSARTMTETLAAAHSALAYGSVVISIVIVAAFGVACSYAISGHLAGTPSGPGDILVGTLAAMATQVANYWLGSSSGSRGKDLSLANSMPVPAGVLAKVVGKK